MAFSVPTDVINLCRKIWIQKSRDYGGQAMLMINDDKSKQIYKVKINNIQGYDPYHIKRK